MSSRASLVLALFVCALACGGCGRGADEAASRAVTQRFLDALTAHDGAGACAQLSPDTVSAVESQEHRRCPIAILGLGLDSARVVKVAVYLTSAKADLSDGESAFLDQSPQGWRLSAVGCKPQGGKPADEPFDCDLQA
jgi:hypothetical protein